MIVLYKKPVALSLLLIALSQATMAQSDNHLISSGNKNSNSLFVCVFILLLLMGTVIYKYINFKKNVNKTKKINGAEVNGGLLDNLEAKQIDSNLQPKKVKCCGNCKKDGINCNKLKIDS